MNESHSLELERVAQRAGSSVDGTALFRDISLRWESPALHVIMGPSGSGKSTLLKSLGGVWAPAAGTVRLNNELLWTARGAQNPRLLRQIGFAFQNNALFSSMRVLENLAYPHRQRFGEIAEPERRRLAQDWLAKVGLEASAAAYPYELSGGMQKRLSIARALILKPNFIFLDDPTAGLDPITSRTMAELLAELLRGQNALVVVVTNDPDRARDWGPNRHYLVDQKLFSPGSAPYAALEKRFS